MGRATTVYTLEECVEDYHDSQALIALLYTLPGAYDQADDNLTKSETAILTGENHLILDGLNVPSPIPIYLCRSSNPLCTLHIHGITITRQTDRRQPSTHHGQSVWHFSLA